MPSPIAAKTPKSADAILASYLEQQEKQLQSLHNNNNKRTHTNSKAPYKQINQQQQQQQLDCSNLINSPTSHLHNHSHNNQPARTFFPHLSDNLNNSERENSINNSPSIVQIQRKFLALFYIYVLIIVSLYLTYAVYCYYQQNQFKKQQELQQVTTSGSSLALQTAAASLTTAEAAAATSHEQQQLQELQNKLEGKIHLLERYIEMLAVDLEGTKVRLSEREKCACSIGCSFNGTKYADQQSWTQKCDLCKCQAGKISCQPRECPKLACQNDPAAVIETLPGQCCPTCMKKCKVNRMLVRHGHSFKPMDSNGQQTKQCKCHDGLIKCEPLLGGPVAPIKPFKSDQLANLSPRAANKTIEYLRSILSPKLQLKLGDPKSAST